MNNCSYKSCKITINDIAIKRTIEVNKFFIRCATSVFLLTLSTAVYAAVAPAKMTLQEAVATGILKSPDYGQAAQDSLATREVLFQAKGLNLPTLSLSTETGPEYENYLGIPAKNQDMWHSRASLSLSQLLFDGWGTMNQIRSQKAKVESSVKRAGEAAEFAGLDSIESFLDVLRQRELLEISRSNVDAHLKILDMIEAGAKAGTVTQGDVAQIKARLAQSRATVASSEENLRKAESLFAQKVGDVPGDLADPVIPRSNLSANVDEAVHVALLHNPTLAVTKADVDAAAADQAGASALLYPRVDLQANESIADNISGIPGNNQSRTILAVAKWNLYHGGADKARMRETLYRTASAKERRNQSLRQVEKEVRDTWAGMVSAADRAKDYEEQISANEKVVSVYLDQFNMSRRTLLDVLDAQNELFISRSNNLDAVYAEKFAVFRVLALQGRLLDTLNVPKPREAMLEH